MGSSDAGTPAKTSKAEGTAPGGAPGASGYPEWAAAFQQAYYNQGAQAPPGYFNPATSGPQPHHYMWTGQHMMPPYGTPPPPPYGAMYPPGAMYGHHPNMPSAQQSFMNYGLPSPSTEAAGQTTTTGQDDVKSPADAANDKSRKPKGSAVKLPTVTIAESSKLASPPGNGVFSQSGEDDDDDDDDDADDDNNTGHDMQMNTMEGVQRASSQGMGATVNYWQQQQPPPGGGGGAAGSGKKRPGPTSISTATGVLPGTPGLPGQGLPPELWMQDEREVKRQRRKQSNRESARRSRLRKQAECEELGTRVDGLTQENGSLRTELSRLHEECRRLQTENERLQEQLRMGGSNEGMGSFQAEPKQSPRFKEGPAGNATPAEQSQRIGPIVNSNVNSSNKEDESGSGSGAPDTVAAG